MAGWGFWKGREVSVTNVLLQTSETWAHMDLDDFKAMVEHYHKFFAKK